jgi:hypothetical protein
MSVLHSSSKPLRILLSVVTSRFCLQYHKGKFSAILFQIKPVCNSFIQNRPTIPCVTALNWTPALSASNSAVFLYLVVHRCGSQWLRGLRQEMSSPAQTLRSWVGIPLEAGMSVRVSSVLSCVRSGLATGLIPRPRCSTDWTYKIHSLPC